MDGHMKESLQSAGFRIRRLTVVPQSRAKDAYKTNLYVCG
jgi:hypothetical protein